MRRIRPIVTATALAAALSILPACSSISITSPNTTEEETILSTAGPAQDNSTPPETAPAASIAPTSEVSDQAQALFDARVQYIGDNSAVGQLLTLLDLDASIGGYTMELGTSEEPYSLTINFSSTPEDIDAADTEMTLSAQLLLALIDNCDTVQWRYDGEAGLRTCQTSDQLKAAGLTAAGVQSLLDHTSGIVSQVAVMDETITNTTPPEPEEANAGLLGLYTLDMNGDEYYIFDYVEVTAATADSITFDFRYNDGHEDLAAVSSLTVPLSGNTTTFATDSFSGQLKFSEDTLTLTVDSSTGDIPVGTYTSITHWKPVPAQLTVGALIFEFPQSYQDKVLYSVSQFDGNDSYEFNQAESLRSISGGWLFGVSSSQGTDYQDLPSYDTLTNIDGLNYYVYYPTDVQFDPDTPDCQTDYTALASQIDSIVLHYITVD